MTTPKKRREAEAQKEKATADRNYETAVQALRILFGDKTVSQEKTRTRLQGLRDEIDMMIDALNQDLKSRSEDS
jgi:hypothetical protein